MADARSLYQEVILDHNRKPRNYGSVGHATHRAEGRNPLCGDRLTLTLALAGERIEAIAFEGESCAICKASASMMTTAVKGRNRDEAEALAGQFRDMVTGRLDPAQAPALGRLAVFAGVRELPSRVKCAVLPWHTLHAAMNAIQTASTEGENDPAPE